MLDRTIPTWNGLAGSPRETSLRIVLIMLLLPLAVIGLRAAAADLPPPAIGPVTLGMSIDDVMKAAPAIAWEKYASPVTGRTLEISANRAWTLDGLDYAIRYRPQAYRWSTLTLNGLSDDADRQDCRRHVIALASQLEPRFPNLGVRFTPALSSPAPGGTITAQRSPEGYVTVTGQPDLSPQGTSFRQELVSVGKTARVLETTVNEDRTTWEFEQPLSAADPYAVRVLAFYDEVSLDPGASLESEAGPACVIEATLQARPKGRPEFETLDLSTVKPVERPGRDLLHDTLNGTALPVGGMRLAFDCTVARMKGRLEDCRLRNRAALDTAPSESLALEMAALARLDAWRFDPKALDPDSDVPLKADMTVHLSPKDRDPKRAAAAGPVPVWRVTATPHELSREYPPNELRDGIGATVTATCRIREDLSLECLSYETDPPGLTRFHAATGRVLSRYRAAPRLRNDTPAAGTTTKVKVRFVVE